MSNIISWDNPEQTILRIDLLEQWDLGEFQQIVKEAHKHIQSQTHPVCLVFTFSKTTFLPKGILPILYRMQLTNPHNQAAHIIVSDIPTVRSLFSMLQRITKQTPSKIHITDKIENARAICQQCSVKDQKALSNQA